LYLIPEKLTAEARVVKLGEIAALRAGLHFRGMIQPEETGSIPVIQVKDFDDSLQVDRKALTRVRPDREVDRYLVRTGDVLFLARGTRPFAVRIDDELDGAIAPNHFFILRIRGGVDPAFLAWYLNAPPAQATLRTRSQGSNVHFVSQRDLAALEVPVPPLDTQQRIVQITTLVQRERQLVAALTTAREQMVDTLCLEAARGSI
jgi:restriction endonuclease S subunit